jgi:cytochrome c oxidase assembly protein subunit 15
MAIRLFRFDSNHPLRFLAHLMVILVAEQVMLGGYVIWSGKQPHITSLHVMVGASTLALSVILTLASRTVAWRKERRMAELHEVHA